MNYIKYVRKSDDELTSVLKDRDRLFVVACNKCFKDFEIGDNPDLEMFCGLAVSLGKKITGTAAVDFLCNRLQTEKKLTDMIPAGTENVIVLSCGLGIQTVADIEDLPVAAAADSLNYIGYHGMALTPKTCDACDQCYLNMTGGICPIVDCTKSLLNGQCGGAKNGKCEIDPKKDCAWEKIYQRLKKQGRLEEFLSRPVELRDYSKVNFKKINAYVKSVREKRLEGYYGGIHPVEKKELTEAIPIAKFPEPETVVIPVSMHAGAPASVIVAVGDYVKLGQKIAEASAYISCSVHSSVSGTVAAIEPRLHPSKGEVLSVVIRSDGKNVPDESVKPGKELAHLSSEEIVEIVKDKGIAGMGGAGFPTYVKLLPGKPIDTVLINGSECEPYITADHRVLLEYADDVIFGLKAVMKAVNAPKGIIVIEDNKPDAIALMQSKLESEDALELCSVKTKYPEGAEKMLIKRVTGRMVPSGGLPADVGTVVCNVSTAKAISDAIQKGMPLVERAVTVSGEHIARPGNFMVKIGTGINELIDYCGGFTGKDYIVKTGGPMMGAELKNTQAPVIKGTNAVIAVAEKHEFQSPCIQCGRCTDVCPMELSPLYFAKYADEGNTEGLIEKHVMDCIECGCCECACSSKGNLVSKIRAGKQLVREKK